MPRSEVFLSHSSADKESVRTIALQLQQRSIPIWLDEWNLIPGEPWVLLSAVDEGFRGEIDPPGCRVAILQTTASPSWSRILVRHAG